MGTNKMSRRSFVAAVGAASLATQTARGESPAARPNILFIIADQHRAECLGHRGNSDIRTPHLDALARDGVVYEECFCPYPVCTPSRYSILSGQYVNQHHGWSNRCTLNPTIPTFPKRLRAAGYKTACVGKMHFTPTYLDVGYDEMDLSEQDGDGRWDDDYHRDLMANGLCDINDMEDQIRQYREHAREAYWESFGAMAANLPLEHHSTEWAARKAIDRLNTWGPEGNLLTVSFVKPHHPFDPPAELQDLYDPAKLTLLPGWMDTCPAHDLAVNSGYFPHDTLTENALRRVMAYYYATIEHIDRQVGRMVDTLKRKGQYENTMIVYCSDHGEYLGYHHMLLKGNHMYDALARVPLTIKYAGGHRAGERSKALVSLVDLAPTVLHQAGVAPVEKMAGLNLHEDNAGRDMVFCESANGKRVMARTRDHKLLLSRDSDEPLFFDLHADPTETTNRADDPAVAATVADMQSRADAWQNYRADFTPYLDLEAPVIQQPNVPRDTSHRPAIQAYFDAKIKEALHIA